MSGRTRCPWAEQHELLRDYHDTRWGVPVRDDRELFGMLVLEGQQAGLSWLTVLKKEEGYRAAFDDLDPEAMASLEDEDVERLLEDPGLIRSERKLTAAIENARAFLEFQEGEDVGFAEFLWDYVDGEPIVNRWESPKEVPSKSSISQGMACDLEEHGFSFVGPTICYAFMQAVGMVNDHLVSCWRYGEVGGEAHGGEARDSRAAGAPAG